MPDYSMFVKDMVITKRSVSFEDDNRMHHYSGIARRSLMQKKEDPGAFTIPCTIILLHFAKPLSNLSANINLMPLSFYKKLGLSDPKPTMMRLRMTDRTVKRSIVIHHDVHVKVESFIFLANFVILDCEVDFEVPIILGRSFLATWRALFRLKNEEATSNICRSMKQSGEIQTVSAISYRVESISNVQTEERLGIEALATVIMNFERDGIEYYGSLVAATERNGYRSKPKKLELDMKNHESSPAKPPIKEAPKLELTVLPPHLRYVLLGKDVTLQVTIAVDLNGQQVECVVEVLKRFK
ncbi:uncharacterized protein [Solanum lycopersicum]|uniref:uncharacterized protein n=1 Tax=Solanum lycopersicum TaxID=4081 RepID=UPI003748B078